MILGIIVGAGWFGILLLGQLTVLRLLAVEARPRAHQRLFLGGITAIVLTLAPAMLAAQNHWLAQGGLALAFLCGALVFTGLFILYMPFYYVVVASLSVATLVRLQQQSGGDLPLAALRAEFAGPSVVAERLATMVKNGFLARRADEYVLTRKGERVAVIFETLKRLWKRDPGG